MSKNLRPQLIMYEMVNWKGAQASWAKERSTVGISPWDC